MIHAYLDNLHAFGQMGPRYTVTDYSKSASIYGKIILKNKVLSIGAYAQPSLDNANPRVGNYGIGFDVAMNIDYVTVHGYIEPWDLDQKEKTQVAFGGDAWIKNNYYSVGAGYDHNSVVDGRFQNTYKVMQGFDYKVLHIQLFEGVSSLYDSQALLGAQVAANILTNVSVYAKDSVYIGNLNKLETGITFNF